MDLGNILPVDKEALLYSQNPNVSFTNIVTITRPQPLNTSRAVSTNCNLFWIILSLVGYDFAYLSVLVFEGRVWGVGWGGVG
jgi:hypothetical protein